MLNECITSVETCRFTFELAAEAGVRVIALTGAEAVVIGAVTEARLTGFGCCMQKHRVIMRPFSDTRVKSTTGIVSGVNRGGAPGDTLQGVTPEGKIFVGKFTKNSGETRSDR